PEKRLEHVAPDALATVFAVNAFGPILVAKHVAPLLHHDRRAVFAAVSARVGSIGDNRLGGWYAYRASKSALNQLLRTLSIELARRSPNVIVVSVHPGTVDTDLSHPFQRRVPAHKLFSTERAADQLIDVIDGLTPEDTGSFRAWDGSPIEW
ncbi:MAG: SDR family NAD(P)-dependent oxidoreductase, partial [Myxococcota bacterium]